MTEPSNTQQNIAVRTVLRRLQANTAKVHKTANSAGSPKYATTPVTFGRSMATGTKINTAPAKGLPKRNAPATQTQTQISNVDKMIFLWAFIGQGGEQLLLRDEPSVYSLPNLQKTTPATPNTTLQLPIKMPHGVS